MSAGPGYERGRLIGILKQIRNFENTVIETLNRIHAAVVKNIAHNNGLKDEEILVELLWLPNRMTDDFRFVRKTMAYVQGHGEFSELREKMLEDKKRQYSYFLDQSEG